MDFSRMIERRSQPRLLDSELVMIFWEYNGSRLMQLGNVNEVSLDGMSVLVGIALPVGTSLKISYGAGELTGIVRHKTEMPYGQVIGIEFAETSKNSTLHFQPELLTR